MFYSVCYKFKRKWESEICSKGDKEVQGLDLINHLYLLEAGWKGYRGYNSLLLKKMIFTAVSDRAINIQEICTFIITKQNQFLLFVILNKLIQKIHISKNPGHTRT